MTAGTAGAGALAERYLRAVAAQDWATVQACVAPDVVRLGPFGDDVEGRGPYLELLQRTMPALPGYHLDIDRVTEVGGGRGLRRAARDGGDRRDALAHPRVPRP